ncbi:MAG: hypothetical protein QXJ17_07750 [Nitrososphaeria archaeon]
MKRPILIIGLVVLVIGLVLVLMPSGMFNSLMEMTGLTIKTYNTTSLIETKVITVPRSNYNISFITSKDMVVVGNYTVVTEGKVSVFCFDKEGYNLWSHNKPVTPLFYTKPSENNSFSHKTSKHDTYYLVLVSSSGADSKVIISVDLVEEKTSPSMIGLVIGPGLIALGSIIVLSRISPDIIEPRIQKRKKQQEEVRRIIRVAMSLGIPVQGKTLEQIRKDIREYLEKKEIIR